MEPLLLHRNVRASRCDASGSHRPVPLRFVWHHVQPHEAGGPTETANLVQLCDTCHYSVHRLLWYLRLRHLGEPLNLLQEMTLWHPPRREQLHLARKGLDACIAAGTVEQIPNEG